MQAYLLTDPIYSFKHVWLWNEFPSKGQFGGKDTGIDIVALTHNGDYWAVQCKCYQEDAVIDKPAVDSFLATSGRQFADEHGKTIRFSHRLWLSTTSGKWSDNAEESIRNQVPPVSRTGLYDLVYAPVDWEKLDQGISGEISRTTDRSPKAHQIEAIEKTNGYFKNLDRGKLIMACGTGKTYTSLKIAENETDSKGFVLFLVPSIALLGQTLREWTSFANEPIHPVCICSDPEVSKKKSKNEDSDTFSTVDLALPATTDVKRIVHQLEYLYNKEKTGMKVVFSTYQSIEVIAEAQKELMSRNKSFGKFDLVICDEAHRTTGVTLAEKDESAFVKVHDNSFITAKKRIYMTATPRLYSADAKSKAAEKDAELCSMDDIKLYGEEIYRIGFGEAVDKDLLSDYKVLVLALSDKDISPEVQKMISGEQTEISTDDASKLIGCINALSKQIIGDEGSIKETDPEPMRRAVAFCQSIKISKAITNSFNTLTETYPETVPPGKREKLVSVACKHIDGTMSAPTRDDLVSWLKSADETANECRVLTNVRCLSEGVDVPSLDAVMFLSARNSQVDVVQSVGRVMRKSPGKKYGYIIIPVVVPSDIPPEQALDDNERFKVVWSVLNALRAHDDRFNATVNKIELNKKKPKQIIVGTPGYGDREEGDRDGGNRGGKDDDTDLNPLREQLQIEFEKLQDVVFAKMVMKVGSKVYWEKWAKDVAAIAERQVKRIKKLKEDNPQHRKAFEKFLGGLRKNINPSITEDEAVDMLSQHIITRPVFEALFENYSFVKNNAISISMQKMLDLLESQNSSEDMETLESFYESVRKRAEDIDNSESKQKIIIELYDKFFKTAFPKMVEKLGIVYTPVEVVDFIIHSVNDILKKEFNRSLTDENIHILDPFTGTGTFITRLLQSGLIKKKDFMRKYEREIHANEIVLLAYYISAVNIENAFHDLSGSKDYKSFEGICLTDTFQLGETDASEVLFSEIFPQNSERVKSQKKAPLRVIIGNPPYSVGQKSANDNAQNQKYEKLDNRIAQTYAVATDATNKNSLYDSYIKAFRWSTDRLDKSGGIIAFVSNGAWIDGNATDGFRKCLEKEFSSIYVFNLRGNCRTQGELRRKEAGNVFGLGSRTPISITLLVKKPEKSKEKATIHYHDIGDYLNREEKLKIISKFKTIANPAMNLIELQPNEHGDWISQRNDSFENFMELLPARKRDLLTNAFFVLNSNGIQSNRDNWVYNFSHKNLAINMEKHILFYNEQVTKYLDKKKINPFLKADKFIDINLSKISWSSSLISNLERGIDAQFQKSEIVCSSYRPYTKMFLYKGEKMIHRRGQFELFFPFKDIKNVVICIGIGNDFSILITDGFADSNFSGYLQAFPLYYYEKNDQAQMSVFDQGNDEYIRRDGISDFILERALKIYGKNVTKEDIFYYVYGFLHCPEYREKFANDLKKMLPRLPLVEDVRDFWKFSKAGRALADLHINYETVPPYEGVKVSGTEKGDFKVDKMKFPKKGQKDTIIYNDRITIENIPERAYEYVVNGRSAIEWIMERYRVTVDLNAKGEGSGIKNDPNDWADEVGNPRYILDLLLSIINVSLQTLDIVESLPKVRFE